MIYDKIELNLVLERLVKIPDVNAKFMPIKISLFQL
jgi:hypothetical protein